MVRRRASTPFVGAMEATAVSGGFETHARWGAAAAERRVARPYWSGAPGATFAGRMSM